MLIVLTDPLAQRYEASIALTMVIFASGYRKVATEWSAPVRRAKWKWSLEPLIEAQKNYKSLVDLRMKQIKA